VRLVVVTPSANAIFNCLHALADHPDVLTTRLVQGKVTFVHRWLWPAVYAVATSHAPLQMGPLSARGRQLYEAVEQQGVLMSTGELAHEVTRRLLVHNEQVHTPLGHHELRLERWSLWADRIACPATLMPSEGQAQLEAALHALGGMVAMLPWDKH
jgi:hypothetical protein